MKQTKHIFIFTAFIILCFWGCVPKQNNTLTKRETLFNKHWEFTKANIDPLTTNTNDLGNDTVWENVSIPHSANIEPLVITGNQWQGNCYYRKYFTVPESAKEKHLALYFEGAMQIADIYINNKHVFKHEGGYLPFYVELNKHIKYGEENCLIVKLNNENNASVPPGKPIEFLDFNYYSGIYRNVWLVEKNRLHITNSTNANKVAGGGIFVTYPKVTKELAQLVVKVDVDNELPEQKTIKIELQLKQNNTIIKRLASAEQTIGGNSNATFNLDFSVANPELWSPKSPNLYTLTAMVLSNGIVADSQTENIGIRSINFSAKNGFVINDEPLKLRGTNRHQEYPYVGYAISDNANYRDAWKIKRAGFNFVRLSHYPQSQSFLNACDELGILVMDAIPGWQFFGDSIFQENAIKDVRNMIRAHRNHPSIILWEASLNESGMTTEFMEKSNKAVHEEYPSSQTYTCGWLDKVYDVFIPARQHSKAPFYWNKYAKDKPLFIAEYGDWEYYAQNAGFNQKAYDDLTDDERNSRQLRAYGQKRLAQQALNYQESHNSNLAGPACGDANWLMFDYNRGYAPDIESSGIMDIFRLPKFAYYFYQSQADNTSSDNPAFSKPMIYIANYFNDPSFLDVKVYSNCDEVELLLNGISIEKRKPDTDENSTYLKHAPFTFNLSAFVPGTLTAKGYIGEKEATSQTIKTPEDAKTIKLWIDESGKKLEEACNDIVFVHAAIVDKNQTIIPDAQYSIEFKVEGDAKLIGNNPIEAEAGIATILLQAGKSINNITINAKSEGLEPSEIVIK